MTSNAPSCPCCGAQVSPLDIFFEPTRGLVVYNGGTARLTPKQFLLFKALVDSYPRTLTKVALLDAMTPVESPDDAPEIKLIDVLVCKIRKLLDPMGLVIATAWGTGYSLELDDAARAGLARSRVQTGDRPKSALGSGEIALVEMLVKQGYSLTEVARRANLTYRATMNALDEIKAKAATRPVPQKSA